MAKLFDPNNTGQELAWCLKFIDLLVTCPAMHDLAETSDSTAIRSKIDIGRHEKPFAPKGFTRGELENRMLFVLLAADPEESLTAGNPSHYTAPSYGSGSVNLTIRRQVRASEDPTDVLLFFWDRTSELLLQAKDKTIDGNGTNLRGGDFVRTVHPHFPEITSVSAQGEHLGVEYALTWGDNA